MKGFPYARLTASAFDNISIRKKFILVYIFCICLPVVVGAIVWLAFTSREMLLNETHYLDQTMEGATSDFYILTQTAVNIANQVNADKTVLNDLSKSFSTPAEHYDLYWSVLRNRFKMYLVSNPDISEITLYIDDPHFINVDYFRVIDDDVRKSDWYKAASGSDSDIVVYPGSTAITITAYQNRITVIRKINAPDYLNNATNYLHIELRLDRIINKLNLKTEAQNIYLTFRGDIIWGTQFPSGKDGGHRVLELPPEDKYYILRTNIGPKPWFEDWEITSIYNKNQIYKRPVIALVYILLIALSLAIFSVFLLGSVLNSMRYRLLALSEHMKKVRKDHFEPLMLARPGRDEVGWLITAFNNMIAEINGLINDVYKLEMQKKSIEVENIRAEYQYLQAQVDPHFLFNTLNAILVFCVKNHYTELTAIISSLSKLLKRLLGAGRDFIPVSEEFDFIDKYLTIEKFRFGDKFEYEIRIAPEVNESQLLIPKMSVQPLVENACKHGLQPSADEDSRRLVIEARIEDGSLVISIRDNGAGMTEEKVDAILKRIESSKAETDDKTEADSEKGSGVGIQNVYRRMKMNYGERFRFTIRSAPGQGTEILLRIGAA